MTYKVGLVLGSGAVPAFGYHFGVLSKLEEAGIVSAKSAFRVIGTSAGSAVGAILRYSTHRHLLTSLLR